MPQESNNSKKYHYYEETMVVQVGRLVFLYLFLFKLFFLEILIPTHSLPEEVNLGSHITMEVDDEYDWMEEAGYKLVEGLLPVSKRQQ